MGIVLEIKKFKVVVFVKVDETPIAIANRGVGRGAAGVVMGIMPIKRTRGKSFALEQRKEVHPIVGGLDLGGGGDGGKPIHGDDWGRRLRMGFGLIWPENDRGDANPTLVSGAFPGTKTEVLGNRKEPPVVARKNDHCAIGELEFLEFGAEGADALIDRRDHRRVLGVFVGSLGIAQGLEASNHWGWGAQRGVNGEVRKIKEPRVALIFFDPSGGFAGEAFGELFTGWTIGKLGIFVRGKVGVWLTFAVVGEGEVKASAGSRLVFSKMPLAEVGGGVPFFAQKIGDRDGGGGQLFGPVWNPKFGFGALVTSDPIGEMEAGGVLAGEKSGAGGRADRASGVGLGKFHPIEGQPINMGSLVKRRAVASEVGGTEVIDKHDQVIERGLGVGERGSEEEEEQPKKGDGQ